MRMSSVIGSGHGQRGGEFGGREVNATVCRTIFEKKGVSSVWNLERDSRARLISRDVGQRGKISGVQEGDGPKSSVGGKSEEKGSRQRAKKDNRTKPCVNSQRLGVSCLSLRVSLGENTEEIPVDRKKKMKQKSSAGRQLEGDGSCFGGSNETCNKEDEAMSARDRRGRLLTHALRKKF